MRAQDDYLFAACKGHSAALWSISGQVLMLWHQRQAMRQAAAGDACSGSSSGLLPSQPLGTSLSAPTGFPFSADALRAAGMQAEVAVQLSEQRRAAADQQAAPPATPSHPPETASCLVCFEEQRSDVLAVQLPCRHPTCQSCWQVSCTPWLTGHWAVYCGCQAAHLLCLVLRASWKRDCSTDTVCPPCLHPAQGRITGGLVCCRSQ